MKQLRKLIDDHDMKVTCLESSLCKVPLPDGGRVAAEKDKLENLIRQVLELPLDQRAALAERLLESLDELTPEELQQVWAAEAERRYQAYTSGNLGARDGADTHREILDEVR